MLKEFLGIDKITDHVKEYIDTRLSLLKVTMAEKISKLVSLLIAGAVLFFLFFFFFILVSVRLMA